MKISQKLIATLLGLSVLLWVLGRANEPKAGFANVEPRQVQPVDRPQQTVAPSGITTEPLPARLERFALEPASGDPFTQPQAVAVPPPAKRIAAPAPLPQPVLQPVTQQLAPTPPAQTPLAPPLGLTYIGRMTSPDGNQLVFATMGDASVTLSPGLLLPNGYQVTSITERAVQLLYPPLRVTAQLDLPALPRHEIR